jgi:hypothetical protein
LIASTLARYVIGYVVKKEFLPAPRFELGPFYLVALYPQDQQVLDYSITEIFV